MDQLTTVLSVPSRSGRVIAMSAKMDFDDELRNFSDAFLAPVAIPPARRQYDVDKPADMTELSIRFMGTDWYGPYSSYGWYLQWFEPASFQNCE